MRVEKTKNYTKNFSVIHNKIYKNTQMSYRTKGLFSDLWHLPNDWSFNERELAKRSTDGLTSIVTGIKTLEKYGYLQIIKKSNGKTLWILSDRGKATEFLKKSHLKPDNSPHHDKPNQAHRHLLNTHQTKQESLQNTIKLHVQSSKSKSKNSNKDYDDSLASNKVHSKAGFTVINSKKAGAQAHLARRGSSKHSSRFSNSKYSAIDSLLHDAFPNFDELVTRKSYERKCISSWLNGNKKLNTPSFSMSEIENAIDKAKKYNKQPRRPVLNPLALVFDILQTSRKEESDTKVNQKKYQNKKSKANNASSKSSNSSTSLDESDPMEAAEIRDLSKDDNSDHEIAIYYQTIIKGLNNVLNPYFEEMADKYSSIKAWDKRDKLDKYIKKHVRTMSAFLYAYNQFDNFSLSACEKQKKDPVKVAEKMFVKE